MASDVGVVPVPHDVVETVPRCARALVVPGHVPERQPRDVVVLGEDAELILSGVIEAAVRRAIAFCFPV
jgi:hypothetical protein